MGKKLHFPNFPPNGERSCPSLHLSLPFPDGENTPTTMPPTYTSTSPYRDINSPPINPYLPHLIHSNHHFLRFSLFFPIPLALPHLPLLHQTPSTLRLPLLFLSWEPAISHSSSFLFIPSDPTHHRWLQR